MRANSVKCRICRRADVWTDNPVCRDRTCQELDQVRIVPSPGLPLAPGRRVVTVHPRHQEVPS